MPKFLIFLRNIYDVAEKFTLVLGTLLLTLWAVKPSRDWLEANLLFDASTISAVMAFVVLLVYKTLIALQKSVESTQKPEPVRIVNNGVNEVYPLLTTMVTQVNNATSRRGNDIHSFGVLGLTLFTAWTHLEGVLLKPDMNGWRLQLLCLAPDFIRQNPTIFDPAWELEAQAKLDQIATYISANAVELQKNNVWLEVRTYEAVPSLHGFSVGSYEAVPSLHGFSVGSLEIIMSFTHWGNNDRLNRPYDFYEHVVGDDHSKRAQVYRRLFRNWFEHAMKHSKVVAEFPSAQSTGSVKK